MAYVDRDAMMASDLDAEDLDVPGLGTVKVRGLSRKESLEAAGKASTPDAWERVVITYGLVEPQLSVEDVEQFQSSKKAAVVRTISDRIIALSALDSGAPKSVVAEAGA